MEKSPGCAVYVSNNEGQASFDNDIKNEVILSQSCGFGDLKERGRHYGAPPCNTARAHLRRLIDRHVAGGSLNKNIFLCGPSPMMASLMAQFKSLGVRKEQIVIEDFNLV